MAKLKSWIFVLSVCKMMTMTPLFCGHHDLDMPEAKTYPRPFTCKSPTCGRLIGVVDRDRQKNVSLYVLRNPLVKGSTLSDIQLTKRHFVIEKMAFGVVVCLCGYETIWHWNQHLADTLIKKRK